VKERWSFKTCIKTITINVALYIDVQSMNITHDYRH